MRVLLACPQDGATGSYIAHALTQHGAEVSEYDYRLISIRRGTTAMNAELVDLGKEYDLVLVVKGEAVTPNALMRIRNKGVPVAVWNLDPREGRESWVINLAEAADCFFTIGKGLVDEYRRMGINAHWLLEAADPEMHHPYPIAGKDPHFGVSFVGTVAGVDGRDAWLNAIHYKWPQQLHVFGSYPGEHSTFRHHGRANGDKELCWVISHTAINLGRDRNPEIERSYGARLFRTLAAGGFLLTNATKGIRDDFPGCLAVYDSTEDCLEQIERFLHAPEQRAKIAAAGRKFVLAHHTWDVRMLELLQTMKLV